VLTTTITNKIQGTTGKEAKMSDPSKSPLGPEGRLRELPRRIPSTRTIETIGTSRLLAITTRRGPWTMREIQEGSRSQSSNLPKVKASLTRPTIVMMVIVENLLEETYSVIAVGSSDIGKLSLRKFIEKTVLILTIFKL